jgi:hypothetical protein
MGVRSKTYAASPSVPDALLIVGRDGSIVFANQHAERLFGYEPGQLVGVEIEALLPERYRQRHAELRAKFSADPTVRPWDSGGSCSPGAATAWRCHPMALPGTSWHYRTEPTFSNSEATPVGYRIPGTASEAGGRAFESRPGHHLISRT